MNGNELFASLVSSLLSFPVAIVVTVYMLKDPITKILNSINRLTISNFQLDFGEEADVNDLSSKFNQVKEFKQTEKLDQEKPDQEESDQEESDQQDKGKKLAITDRINKDNELESFSPEKIKLLAAASPSAAVLESFLMVERTLATTVIDLELTNNLEETKNPRKNIDLLKKNNLLSDTDLLLYNKLSKLRNLAAHGGIDDYMMTYTEVLEYYSAALTMVKNLKAIN